MCCSFTGVYQRSVHSGGGALRPRRPTRQEPPVNDCFDLTERRGQWGRCGVRRERFGIEPYPEAANAHLELSVHSGARPRELGEGLSARGAHDRRGTAVVQSGLPQLIDERPRGDLTQDGESGCACAAHPAHPDQAVTPRGWFKGLSTQRAAQWFHTRYLPAS